MGECKDCHQIPERFPAHGLCNLCYQKRYRAGTLSILPKGVWRGVTVKQRFWNNVDKTETCWLWTGASTQGYGYLWVDGILTRAHRYSWSLHHGPIQNGLWVLHKCDNPPCVNPNLGHLFLGDNQDNVNDMWSKGRGVKPPVKSPQTHCARGHIYEEGSFYSDKKTGKIRRCKECVLIRRNKN